MQSSSAPFRVNAPQAQCTRCLTKPLAWGFNRHKSICQAISFFHGVGTQWVGLAHWHTGLGKQGTRRSLGPGHYCHETYGSHATMLVPTDPLCHHHTHPAEHSGTPGAPVPQCPTSRGFWVVSKCKAVHCGTESGEPWKCQNPLLAAVIHPDPWRQALQPMLAKGPGVQCAHSKGCTLWHSSVASQSLCL